MEEKKALKKANKRKKANRAKRLDTTPSSTRGNLFFYGLEEREVYSPRRLSVELRFG